MHAPGWFLRLWNEQTSPTHKASPLTSQGLYRASVCNDRRVTFWEVYVWKLWIEQTFLFHVYVMLWILAWIRYDCSLAYTIRDLTIYDVKWMELHAKQKEWITFILQSMVNIVIVMYTTVPGPSSRLEEDVCSQSEKMLLVKIDRMQKCRLNLSLHSL